MKRSRSWGEGPEVGGLGEKGMLKEAGRQDGVSSGCNGSADDWSLDGREPLLKSSLRVKFGGEKCSGLSRRYLDEEETAVHVCSPLVFCSTDRIDRSDGLSSSSSKYQSEGITSERECSRREGSPGLPSKRSSAMDIDDGKVKTVAVSVDSLGGNDHSPPSEDRGKTKLKESFGGEHMVIAADSCIKEMEEGDLKPYQEPYSPPLHEPNSHTDPKPELEESPRSGGESSSEQKHQIPDDGNASDGMLKETVEAAVSRGLSDGGGFHGNYASIMVNGSEKLEEECKMKLNSTSGFQRLANADVNGANENSKSQNHDPQCSVNEKSPENGAEVGLLCSSPMEEKMESEEDEERTLDIGLDAEEEVQEKRSTDLEAESTKAEGINLETEQVPVILFGPCKDDVTRRNASEERLDHMTDNSDKGKGKSSAISLSDESDSIDDDDAMDGSNVINNFELVFRSNVSKSDKCMGEKQQPESGPLDLALGLPCGSFLNLRHKTTSLDPQTTQSVPPSFCSDSAALRASESFSGSGTFLHNASCSLTHNSLENYEHSVGSHTICQGEPSNESKYRRAGVSKRRSSLANGKSDHFRRILKREKSAQKGAEDSCSIGFSGTKKVLNKIVCEPLPIVCRMIQEMSHQSVTYLRESIGQMVINGDKRVLRVTLQDALRKRSDLTIDSLSKCHRVVLEILVTLKTSLPDFLHRADNVPSSDLAEIFMNLKCRNIGCRSVLPVDECDCKMCTPQNGFCSACMCLVCSSFDSAANTCGWVGCDVCLHWCHTDCALEAFHIRNGLSVTEAQKNPEMQFHCVACGHPSEMFGFVKEVFKACSNDWTADVLARELDYVRKIFSSSKDSRGKQLCDVANHLLMNLENRALHSEVVGHMLSFLTGSSSKFRDEPTDNMKEKHQMKNSLLLEDGKTVLPIVECNHRSSGDLKIKVLEKELVIAELDDVVRLKVAEAEMYQKRADDARREAESFRQICQTKTKMIEEDYVNGLIRLQIPEFEKKRKQKFEQLHALEQAHSEYINMKSRMEEDVKNLMIKMEATRRNLDL